MEEVEALNREVHVRDRESHPDGGSEPRTMANLTLKHVDEGGVIVSKVASRVYSDLRFYRWGEEMVPGERLNDIPLNYPEFVPRDQDWMLRNLTTREFVTATGIAIGKELIEGPFILGIGFGDAVIVRTLWTSSGIPFLRHSHNSQIGRGIWAGHRFEITTRAALQVRYHQCSAFILNTYGSM